jgi:hypothetical protein
MSPNLSLDAIGPAIAEWRRGRGSGGPSPRQSDLAQAARLVGFGWSEPIVARIEAGTRALSLGEGMALATILTVATMDESFEQVAWTDLAETLDVGDGVTIAATDLPPAAVLVKGRPPGWHPAFVGFFDYDLISRAELPREAIAQAARDTWGHTAAAQACLVGTFDEATWNALLADIAPVVNDMYRALGIDREFDTNTAEEG